MLPDTESNNIEGAITIVSKHFEPKDIEELHGLEFHHKTQVTRALTSCSSQNHSSEEKISPQSSASC